MMPTSGVNLVFVRMELVASLIRSITSWYFSCLQIQSRDPRRECLFWRYGRRDYSSCVAASSGVVSRSIFCRSSIMR